MKIAIESNDGVTIKSPFVRTTGYLVYDIEKSGVKGTEYRKTDLKPRTVNPITKTSTMVNDCKTVISRGMDRGKLLSLKERGIDVFITFRLTAGDAVKSYLEENLLNNKAVY